MKQEQATSKPEMTGSQEQINSEDIFIILEKHSHNRGGLIAILESIQVKYGYLPEAALRIISEKTGYSLVDIYGLATFYRFFSLKPKGKHCICACLGTACHVRGSPRTVAELEQQLGIKAGQTTADKEFTLETVNCLGACALGPVVVIDGHCFSKVRKSQVKQLLDQARKGFDTFDIGRDERIFPIAVGCPNCNHSFKDETYVIDNYPSLRMNLTIDHKVGWVRLSSLYGSDSVSSEFDIPVNAIAQFSCPYCNSEIYSRSDCSECGAPMIPMLVEGGGIVQICSRHGCKNRMLDLVE